MDRPVLPRTPSSPSPPGSAGMGSNANNAAHLDLGAKYQKLATEYAKMRAQVSVLKKAVIDEQTKNAQLKEVSQNQEVKLRKDEQEMDSLSFRNKQLERRIQVLQDELAAMNLAKNKTKGKKSSTSASDETHDAHEHYAFDQELVSKIEENIQLHKKISQMEDIHRREMDELKFQMDSKCEYLSTANASHESDKVALTISLQNALDEIEAYREQVAQLQEKIRDQQQAKDNQPSPSKTQGSEAGDNLSVDFKNDNLVETPHVASGLAMNEELVNKLIGAEQQKEHWILEFQLLKMKFAKLFSKWEEAKDMLKQLGKEDSIPKENSGDLTPSADSNAVEVFTTLIGQMEVIEWTDSGEDGNKLWPISKSGRPMRSSLSFEKEVKEYMTEKINELVSSLQMAHSKIITYHSECITMKNLLELSAGEKTRLKEKLTNCQTTLETCQEDLQLTKSNYESQLSTMTEHLANMNDKLSAQQEMIDQLQYQLKSSGSKSSKK